MSTEAKKGDHVIVLAQQVRHADEAVRLWEAARLAVLRAPPLPAMHESVVVDVHTRMARLTADLLVLEGLARVGLANANRALRAAQSELDLRENGPAA